MKLKLVSVLFALAVLAAAGLETAAQGAGGASASGRVTEKGRDIRRLLELTGVIEKELKSIDPIFESFKGRVPNVPASVWAEMRKEFEKEFNAESITGMYVPVYSLHFSEKEIKQLVAFYESPIGRKWVAESKSIETELFLEGLQRGLKLADKVFEKLKARGYDVPVA